MCMCMCGGGGGGGGKGKAVSAREMTLNFGCSSATEDKERAPEGYAMPYHAGTVAKEAPCKSITRWG